MALDTLTDTLNPYQVSSEALSRIDAAESNITTLQSDVSEIQSDITTIETNLESLTNPINAYNGGVFLAFGDSITKGRYVSAAQSWPNLVANKLGMTVYNYAVNSAAFTRTGDLAIETQVDEAIADTTIDKDNVKLIAIAGGVNDAVTEYANSSEIVTALESILNKCIANYPNAKIIVLDFLNGVSSLTSMYKAPASNSSTGFEVHYGIEVACKRYISRSVQCVKSAYCWGYGHSDWFTSTGESVYGDAVNADALHPNATGTAVYASFFIQALITGGEVWPDFPLFSFSAPAGFTELLQNDQSGVKVSNGIVELQAWYTIDTDAMDSASADFKVNLPSQACCAGKSYIPLDAYMMTSNNRTLTPCRATLAQIEAPGGSTLGTYRLVVMAPSGGWLDGYRLLIPLKTWQIGTI